MGALANHAIVTQITAYARPTVTHLRPIRLGGHHKGQIGMLLDAGATHPRAVLLAEKMIRSLKHCLGGGFIA